MIALLFGVPAVFYIENYINRIFIGVYYPFLIWICIIIARWLMKEKIDRINSISINEKGLHYHKASGEIQSILFNQLEKNNEPYSSDIDTETIGRYAPTLLYVYINGKKRSIRFNNTNIISSYYIGNHYTLRRYFVHGVSLFRPDLKIAPSIYSDFFIRKEDYGFDKMKFWKTILAVIILTAVIFCSIEFWISYRFGSSLLHQ
ncbi:hypothetical protein CMT37_12975 [Elizabethkingia anophelis]|nr:hypothetical protein [Elizabethkingia anophelis]